MYIIEIFNCELDDYTIEIETEDELKKMLDGDILDYTECCSIKCLLPCCVDDIIANVNVLGEYEIEGCELTPEIFISVR